MSAHPPCLAAALRYRAMGLRPIPLAGKRPTVRNWNKRPLEPGELAEAWAEHGSLNVGLAVQPGTIVVDVDCVETHDSDGWAGLRALEAQHGALPETWVGVTGGGGIHVWLSAPEDLGNSSGALPDGIDIRGGLRGQVVVWPSVHPDTGRQYQWQDGHAPWDLPLAEAPAWLVETIRARRAPVVRPAVEPRAPSLVRHDRQSQATLLSQVESVASCSTNRNDALNRAAHVLGGHVGAGRLDEFMVVAMLEAAARRCGLEEREIGPTIASGLASGRASPLYAEERHERPSMRREAPERNEAPPPEREPGCDDEMGELEPTEAHMVAVPSGRVLERDSDVVLARMLLEDLRGGDPDDADRAPIVYDQGEFWRYSQERGCFEPVRSYQVKAVAADYDGMSIVIGHDKHGQPRYGELSMRAARLSGCVGIAEALAAKPGFFAEAPPGVAFRNADVSATSVTVVTARPSWQQRRQDALQYDYSPTAECPRWRRFLEEVFARDADRTATIAMVQEFMGAALVGIATKHAKALTLVGGGANGKSVLLDVFSSLFPPALRSAVTPQDTENAFRLAALAGKRLNVVNELPSADILASEKWKAILAANEVMAEKKHRDSFMFRPVAAHVYAANSLPATRDHSEGFWRRQLVAAMDREFVESERDSGLTEYLITHELPGIARWALEGAVRLQQAGRYTVSVTSAAALREWRTDSDPVMAWAEDRLVWGPQVPQTPSLELYQDYRSWVADRGHGAVSHTKWAERLKGLKVERVRNNGAKYLAQLKPRHERAEPWGVNRA